MEKSTTQMPKWVSRFLTFAAIYNLAWGVLTVCFPNAPFRWSGIPAPNYPAFLQCLGVCIGAMGIGYWIAASDAASHWSTIVVGLASKFIWPIVFLCGTRPGDAPPNMLLTILINDVVWWLPLCAVLMQAARVIEARRVSLTGVTLEQSLRSAIPAGRDGRSLFDLSFDSPILLVCIRHLGCTFCREALADLASRRKAIEGAGIIPVVVSMALPDQTAAMLSRYGLSDVAFVSDPERQLFGAFELPFGTFRQFVNGSIIWRALGQGVVFRHGFGAFVGNGLQLSGAFIVRNGRVDRAVRHSTAAEPTDLTALTCNLT